MSAIQFFWDIIETARQESDNNIDKMRNFLIHNLSQLEIPDLMLWYQIFSKYQYLSYKNKVWAAAYLMNGGCGDDSFDYFRGWLTAQGKAIFLRALKDPDSLVDIEFEVGNVQFEEMSYVANYAYSEKLKIKRGDSRQFYSEIKKYPLSEEIKNEMNSEIVYAEDIDLNWDEDSLEQILPKLFKITGW